MTSKIFSSSLVGLNCQLIEVEVDLSPGQLHSFNIVGLPDKAVEESKERISSAIKNSGGVPPHHSRRRVIVNLAPADLKKEGPSYDLPISVAYLVASKQIEPETDLSSALFSGELSLDGKIRPSKGILPTALLAKEKGFSHLFVPAANAKEAAMVKGLTIIPVEDLLQLIAHFKKVKPIVPQNPTRFSEIFPPETSGDDPSDMRFVKGQSHAKRALEIAAAGGHNILMSGPPGSGKTILAKAFRTILPPPSSSEILEITRIFSIAGYLPADKPLILDRPFRSPHHSASSVSLLGGGAHLRPGEITLAHRGVLFMDELPEFHRDVLESLRQPLEEGEITISRSAGSANYPARFIFVAAMNPCPCGKASDPDQECVCSPGQIMRYKRKISGPLLDRIDLHIEVPRIKYEKLTEENGAEESSRDIRQRVTEARAIQRERFRGENIKTNGEMNSLHLKKHCRLDAVSHDLMRQAVNSLHLSARAFHRILKTARTIADLETSLDLKQKHLAEALQYRQNVAG